MSRQQFAALMADFYMADQIEKSEKSKSDALFAIEQYIARAIKCPVCNTDWITNVTTELKEHTITLWCTGCNCVFQYNDKHIRQEYN